MDVRHRGGTPQPGLSSNERIALACALELLPIVGMLAWVENHNLFAVTAVLVFASGVGWALMHRYWLGMLCAATRVALVIVPLWLFIGASASCDSDCSAQFGIAWPLWIAALCTQPVLSALAIVVNERRFART